MSRELRLADSVSLDASAEHTAVVKVRDWAAGAIIGSAGSKHYIEEQSGALLRFSSQASSSQASGACKLGQ